jgi:hypothetical protein
LAAAGVNRNEKSDGFARHLVSAIPINLEGERLAKEFASVCAQNWVEGFISFQFPVRMVKRT